MPDPILAHAGHWLTSLIYVVPVATVALFIVVQQIRMRRHPERYGEEDLSEPSLDDRA